MLCCGDDSNDQTFAQSPKTLITCICPSFKPFTEFELIFYLKKALAKGKAKSWPGLGTLTLLVECRFIRFILGESCLASKLPPSKRSRGISSYQQLLRKVGLQHDLPDLERVWTQRLESRLELNSTIGFINTHTLFYKDGTF